jgi:hypothetical protein
MSTLRLIPASTVESNYVQAVALDGTDYRLTLRWNERSGHWFLTLRAADGTELVTARKLVAAAPVAAYETLGGVPPGVLWVIDLDDSGVDPGLRDLGARCALVYGDGAPTPALGGGTMTSYGSDV